MSLFDEMAVFARVVETGNFTRAAEALGLSKSRTSECVQTLEARLGARLLDRTTRRVAPTEAGRLFYERCRRALEEAEAGVAEVRARQEEPAGRLRVGAPDDFADLYVVPALASYVEAHPKVTAEIATDVRFVDLIEQRLDLAIRVARAPEPSLIVRRLGTSEVVVVASPAHLARHGVPESPDDLAGRPCVAFAALHWAREWPFRGPEGERPAAVDPVLVCSSSTTLRAAVLAGMGLAALPSWAVARELEEGALVRVLADWPLPASGIYAVYPSNRLITPKVRSFVDHLAPLLRARLPPTAGSEA